MNLLNFTQIFPIVPNFEWNYFYYANCIEAVVITQNVSNCVQI